MYQIYVWIENLCIWVVSWCRRLCQDLDTENRICEYSELCRPTAFWCAMNVFGIPAMETLIALRMNANFRTRRNFEGHINSSIFQWFSPSGEQLEHRKEAHGL